MSLAAVAASSDYGRVPVPVNAGLIGLARAARVDSVVLKISAKIAVPFDRELLKRCWFLAGPTACGKTAAGLELARRLKAEILSLDSMAIYRGLDIGTAKPTAEERRTVRHHLVDLVDPHEEFSVADYLSAAENAARGIVSRGKAPLFVGGTGLYLRAILRGLFEGPPRDTDLRRRLEAEARASGAEALHARLERLDPVTAGRLHPNDLRRVVRALEVAEATGRPLSSFHHQSPLPESDRSPHVYWISPPRDWLYARIDARVDCMLDAGLLAETKRLLAAPGGLGRTARQALGYRELVEHLEGGATLAEAAETMKRRTRQFAKRQMTWFRNLEECRAIAITGQESPDHVADKLMNHRDTKGTEGTEDSSPSGELPA